MPSKTIKKPADHKHKVHPGDQTFTHPCSKPHKEQQQNQHLNMPAKAKHFHTVRHPNYCEATNTTCTKSIYSIHLSSAHKESTTITYSNSINEKFQLQQPLQTIHYKTISIQQHKSNLHKAFTVLQQILQPTHFRTITFQIQHISNLLRTSKLQILPAATTSKIIMPTPELLHKTISAALTATRTLYTASIPRTYFPTILTTILCRMKTEDTGYKGYKDIFVWTFIWYTDNAYELSYFALKRVKVRHFWSLQDHHCHISQYCII